MDAFITHTNCSQPNTLTFIFISCCQCACQTLLNVPIDAPFSVPYFPVPPAHGGEGGLSELLVPALFPHTLLGCCAVMGLHLS